MSFFNPSGLHTPLICCKTCKIKKPPTEFSQIKYRVSSYCKKCESTLKGKTNELHPNSQ